MRLPLFAQKLLIRAGVARFVPAVRRQARGTADFLHYFSDRVLTAPLDDLADQAAFPDALSPDTIHLAQAAPRFDAVTAGIFRSNVAQRGHAPHDGLPELHDEIRHQHALTHGTRPDDVLVTAGATGAFAAVLDAFVNPGTRVVAFEPTSPLFRVGLKTRRAAVRWVPTRMEEGRVRFHLGPFASALKGARLLVLADPATATGGTFAPEDLEQIIWWAKHHDTLILMDESFGRFRYDDAKCVLPSLPGTADRVLVAGSVSKGLGLASLRVGWLTGHRHLVRACAVASAMSNPFVPAPCQQMALAAMRSIDADAFEPIRQGFAARRRYVYERLQSLGLQPAWPAGGFAFWVPVSPLGQSGRQFADALLRDRRVLVTPGDVFGPSGSKFVRISYAAEEGRLREGLSRLADHINDLRRVPEMPPQPELAAVG